jgi:hypothetical protein
MGLIRITCREASRLQSQAMDRRLSLGERVSLRLHMSVCDACTAVERQFAFLRKALQQYPGSDE